MKQINSSLLTMSPLALAIGLGLGVASPILHAQADISEENVKPETVEREDVERIVVTSRRRVEKLQEVPDAVTVFTAANIENAGIENFQDFTALTPNLTFAERFRPGVSVITVRGISTSQGGEPPVTVVLDGVQVPGLDFLNQDLFDVQSIEVLRGPQGALYGRGAIGGAVLINTKKPTNDFEGGIKASYGNGNTRGLLLKASGPIVDDKVLYRISGNHRSTDGLIDNVDRNAGSDFADETSLRGTLLFNISEQLTLDIRGSYIDGEAGASGFETVLDTDIDDFSIFPTGGLLTSDNRTIQSFSAKLDYEFSDHTFSIVTSVNDSESLLIGEADWTAFAAARQTNEVNVDAYNVNALITSPDEQRLRWIAGAFYQDRETENLLTIDGDPAGPFTGATFFRADEFRDSVAWAVFGQINYDIQDNLELTLALRYDEDERQAEEGLVANSQISNTFSQVQPKASLGYVVNEDLTFYTSFGRGFRSGGFNDLASSQNPLFERQFDKEISDSFEVGFKSQLWDNKLQLNAALFHIDFDNQQFFFLDAPNFARSVLNVDSTEIKGAELELLARPNDQLELTANFGYADASIDSDNNAGLSGNSSPNANEFTLNLGAQYSTYLTDNIYLISRLDYERRGERYFDLENNFRQSPVSLINARLTLEFDTWAVSLFGKNLADEQFIEVFNQGFPPGAPAGTSARLRNQPRSYGIEFKYDFFVD